MFLRNQTPESRTLNRSQQSGFWDESYGLQDAPEDQKINEIFHKQIEELSEKEFDMGVIEVIKKQERKQGIEQGIEKGIEKGRKQGIEKGRKQAVQKSREVIENLIIELKLTDQEAARIAREDVDFVRKVRKELNQK